MVKKGNMKSKRDTLSYPEKCQVIAEVAQAHDGSLGTAHAYIDAVAAAGADAVKFQTHIASAESTLAEPWRIKFSRQDATRYDYWKRMEFSEEQWRGLKEHADQLGLAFLSSPFSLEAVELLERVGVAAWKVASGEVSNRPMLERMAETSLPFIISTGMSELNEVDEAVRLVKSRDLSLTVLQCTTAYPCPPERIGLNMLEVFRKRYECAVGLSDHSGTIFPSLAATTLGAAMVEVHVTFSRDSFGPDVPASVTLEELRQLVTGVRFIEKMLANHVHKDKEAAVVAPLKSLFSKSIVTRQDLPAGEMLQRTNVTTKKPGTGIPAHRLNELLGRKLRRALPADAFIREDDLEPNET